MSKNNKTPKQAFPTEWKGQQCAVHNEGTYVAKTQAEWETLWNATFSNKHPVPKAPKLPKGKMAIGIFEGQSSKPSAISVKEIKDSNGTAVVVWESETWQSMLAVMNDPFLLKWIDKTDSNVLFTKAAAAPKGAAPNNLNNLKKFGF